MSNHFPTEQVLRDGPIHELPEALEAPIGRISVEFSDGTAKPVGAYFNASTLDAMLVLRAGTVVFERYEAMRFFDEYDWFWCTRSIVAVRLAPLVHEESAQS